MRKIRYKEVLCQWAVSGYDELVHAFVFTVEGYDEPWFLVTTARDLSAEQVVEVFAARFRQEDGFRDHKQRLGVEWRSVGLGRKSPCYAPSRCRWWP